MHNSFILPDIEPQPENIKATIEIEQEEETDPRNLRGTGMKREAGPDQEWNKIKTKGPRVFSKGLGKKAKVRS